MAKSRLKRDFVYVNRVDIFYRDTLAGDETILCLHGRWGRGETWSEFMARYRDRYRIIAPDQRGHGLSDRPEGCYSGEVLAEDMYELVRRLGAGPVIAVGHSMGGRIAGTLAAIHPDAVRALAILDEPAGTPGHTFRLTDGGRPLDPLTSEWPTPYPTYRDAIAHLRDELARETNVRYFLESLDETELGYDYLFSRFAMGALSRDYHDWYDLLERIECPTLLVRAAESWCLSKEEAEKIRQAIRHCCYFEVSGSDHMVYADNPEEFYQGFDLFLRKLT
jgi:2-succinyl-6-hydroxy-2,4-cyclohexadiene-1-carboxylate synthase